MLANMNPCLKNASPLVVSAMLAQAISMLPGWASVRLTEAYMGYKTRHPSTWL